MFASLHIPEVSFLRLRQHLLPPSGFDEEAAFLFVRPRLTTDCDEFEFVDWWPVAVEGFVQRSNVFLELTDATRAAVIKRAHDLNASIVETHSHPFQAQAEFSLSDRLGLREFVPHVWWRLKGRPYAAIVMSPTGFDALCWRINPNQPEGLKAIDTGCEQFKPTGLSLNSWSQVHEL